MRPYHAFEKILETLNRVKPDWRTEVAELEREAQACEQGKTYTLNDHVKKLIFAMLSCQRRWQDLVPHIENGNISAAFYDFDAQKLKTVASDTLYRNVTKHNCGNRRIGKQVKALPYDIELLERMMEDNIYDIAHGFYGYTHNSDGSYSIDGIIKVIKLLAEGQSKEISNASAYKMREMGVALVCEYIKGFGVNVVKPDTHVCRILGRLGYSEKPGKDASTYEAIRVCDHIANEYGPELSAQGIVLPPAILVDTIIWQYGAEEKAEICTKDAPKCALCKAKNDCLYLANP